MTVAPGHEPSPVREVGPPSPCQLTVTGDYTGLTLSWQQGGQVDGWTVYCDPLDGSDTESVFIPQQHGHQPEHRFGDLAPGEHHVGVVSWRSGQPSRGADCWTYASVLGVPKDAPRVPVITDLTSTAETITASWISQDVDRWEVRLLGDGHALRQEHDVIERPHVELNDLLPNTRYGLQVRALNDVTFSPWCEPIWARTGRLARPSPGDAHAPHQDLPEKGTP